MTNSWKQRNFTEFSTQFEFKRFDNFHAQAPYSADIFALVDIVNSLGDGSTC